MVTIIGNRDSIEIIASQCTQDIIAIQHHRDNSCLRVHNMDKINKCNLDNCEIIEDVEVTNEDN